MKVSSSRLTAGWMLSCLALTAILLASISSTAYASLFQYINPNSTAGFITWVAGLLTIWILLSLLLESSIRRFGFLGSSAIQVALLAFGFTAVFYLLLSKTPRFTVVTDPLPGPAALGRAVAFLIPGLVLAILVWSLQSLLTRIQVAGGEDKAQALPIGFALVASYFLTISQWLPSGVSSSFTQEAWLPLLAFSALLYFAVGSIYGQVSNKRFWNIRAPRWRWTDSAFVIVPLTPIASYMIVNRDALTPASAVLLIAASVSALSLLVIAIPRVLAGSTDPRIVMSIASGGAFILTIMPALSRSQAWFEVGSWPFQMATLFAAVVILLAFAFPPPKVLLVAALIFATLQLSISGIESQPEDGELVSRPGGLMSSIDNATWEATPDIIVLIYESYANTETMNAYGIDNSAQVEFLEEQGFTIYDGTYSVGAESLVSMSRFLNASSALDSPNEIKFTSGDAFVPSLLKEKGYTATAVFPSDYYFGTQTPSWDRTIPEARANTASLPLAVGILRGEFRADASFNSIDYGVFLSEKRRAIEQEGSAPSFLYTHNSYPGHSQNSGRCLPNETQIYAERLDIANEEMRIDVEAIVEHKSDAIVVIAGDHSPYLTKNCSGLAGYPSDEIDRIDIQDRYGTFLAIRWPNSLPPDYPIQVLQETLPAVLASASGNEDFWDSRAVDTTTIGFNAGAVQVSEGKISGGKNDGEPLFLHDNIP